MFYYTSKLVWLFLQPSSLLMILTISGILLIKTGRARLGRNLALFSATALLVLGFSPLGNILILPLEEQFPRVALEHGASVDGIIILGGAIDTIISRNRPSLSTNEAAERLIEGANLARRWPRAKVLFSGGSSNLIIGDANESDLAKRLLTDLGVNSNRLILENRSRNTFQNAEQSKISANPKPGERWLLITSAFHMPRAMGCFHQVGFPVQPWPVDYRTRGRSDIFRFFSNPSEGLRRMDLVAREWLGLIAYRLTGRIPSIWPTPRSPSINPVYSPPRGRDGE